MQNLAGQSLGQYTVIRLIGEGGMAAVYQARQESMKRDVAIKVIKTNLIDMDDFVKRFEREAQMVASLSHAHILKVFDYGRRDDLVYLVMELLSGGSLDRLIHDGPLPLGRSAEILDQISSALDYAHQKGIIHRDLKPGNVLLDESGSAFLTDFGLAQLLNTSQKLTQSGASVGTPAYMAPEQWRSQPADARTDVYALGVLLYEMLSGTLPFNGDSALSMMYLHMHEAPPDLHAQNPAIPAAVVAVVAQALAKNSEDRFQSAGKLAAAFRAALSAKNPTIPAAARTTAKQPPATTKSVDRANGAARISPWLWTALVVLVLIAVGVGVAAVSRMLATPIVIPTVAQLAAEAATSTAATETPNALPIVTPVTASATTAPSQTPTTLPSATGSPTVPSPTLSQTPTSVITTTPTVTVAPPTVTIVLPTVALPSSAPLANSSSPGEGGSRILSGHSAVVNSVVFSSDGKYLASGSDDLTARLWSVDTGQAVRTFVGHKGAVKSVAISPDGRYLLTGGADNEALLWDIQTGKQIRVFSGHTGSVNGVAFSPDGKTLGTASDDKTAKLWNTDSGALLRTYSGAHSLPLLGVAFAQPDGRVIATASADKTVVIWDVQSGKAQRTLKGHSGAVQAVAFSMDGRYLISGGADGTARVWDPHNGDLVKVLDDKGQSIMAVGFTPDNQMALTAGQDGQVKSWDPQTGRMTHVFTSTTKTIRSFAFGPRGVLFLATGVEDGTVQVWPIQRPGSPN